MSISFVILTWNSQKDIVQCITSIQRLCQTDNLPYTIYIIDNGSSSAMLDILSELNKNKNINCIYLDRNYGTTYSRNLALKKIDTEYICVLDSDTELINGSLRSLLLEFDASKKIGMIAPKLVLENGEIQNSVKKFPTLMEKILKLKKIFNLGTYHQSDFYENFPFTESCNVDTAISAAWFLPKKILDEVGLFDENIFYAPEDVDYSLRIWKAGYRIVYYPDFEVLHKTQQITHHKPFGKVARSHLKGLLYYYHKHGYWFSRKKIYKKLNMHGEYL